MPALKERVDKHDREIAAIRKLLLGGMKMLGQGEAKAKRIENQQLAAQEEMREMRAYQRETGRQIRELKDTVDRVARSIQHSGGNGHSKKRIE